jgi:hypothetical protein
MSCRCWFSLTVPLRWCCLHMIRVCWHNFKYLSLSIHLIMWQFLSQMLQLNVHQRSVLFQNWTTLPVSTSFTWTVMWHNRKCNVLLMWPAQILFLIFLVFLLCCPPHVFH